MQIPIKAAVCQFFVGSEEPTALLAAATFKTRRSSMGIPGVLSV